MKIALLDNIEKRITMLLSDQESFNRHALCYNNALREAGCASNI